MFYLETQKELVWTAHAWAKMRHYGLSEQRVKRVINAPKRIEEGIAPKTVAMMQPVSVTRNPSVRFGTGGQETWKQEIWVMVQKKRKGIGPSRQETTTVISAWRYPGKTKPGQPLPAEIVRELRNFL